MHENSLPFSIGAPLLPRWES